MSAHTPGPWQAETVDSVVRIHGGVFAGATRAVVEVADVWVPDAENGDAAQIANAALITAAPDLLEALKAMLVSHDNLYRIVFGDPARGIEADPNADIIRRDALAAIAKATGAA